MYERKSGAPGKEMREVGVEEGPLPFIQWPPTFWAPKWREALTVP